MQLPDMNLLPALDALLRTGSVAAAAAELRVSASAMSRTLSRLRRVMGDPLLVKAGRALVLTPRAHQLAPEVAAALAASLAVLAPRTSADLASLQRVLVIRCNDATAMLLGPVLTSAAARQAPGLRFRLIGEGDEDPTDLREHVDLGVGALPPLVGDVRSQTICEHGYLALARATIPITQHDARLTLAQFAALPHITISRRGRAHSVIDDRLAEHGLTRRVLVTVPTIGAACLLALEVDALALVPATIASLIARTMPLRALPIPLELPPVTIGMAWHRRLDTDPAHQWLRHTVAKTNL